MQAYRWRRVLGACLCVVLLGPSSWSAAKEHVITFGKWMSVTCDVDSNHAPRTQKVRPLLVDARMKEYVLGTTHEVTDRLFVARRAFRVNDGLPEDSAPRWKWQRGGWLLVDRVSGRIAPMNLPEFDTYYSVASWYRDYVAYCGVSDDRKKVYAVVAQITRRKPVLKKLLTNQTVAEDGDPDSACPAPGWQRNPARVSFTPESGEKQVFAIRGHVVNDEEEEEEASK